MLVYQRVTPMQIVIDVMLGCMIVLETHVSSMGLVVLMGFPNALWPTHKNCKIEDALRLLYEHCAQTLDLGCYLVYHVYLYLFKTQAGSQLLHWFLFQDD